MLMPTFARANDSTKTKADGMYVSAEYVAQCDLNLKRAKSFKKETKTCESLRNNDKGKLEAKDQSIKVLTWDNKKKDQRIVELESRWSTLRLVSLGAAAASCTLFGVSMVDEGSTLVRVVSGAGCVVGGVLVLKW